MKSNNTFIKSFLHREKTQKKIKKCVFYRKETSSLKKTETFLIVYFSYHSCFEINSCLNKQYLTNNDLF